MGLRRAVALAFQIGRPATKAAPFTDTVVRFVGLDAGDWTMIVFGFSLSALLFVLN